MRQSESTIEQPPVSLAALHSRLGSLAFWTARALAAIYRSRASLARCLGLSSRWMVATLSLLGTQDLPSRPPQPYSSYLRIDFGLTRCPSRPIHPMHTSDTALPQAPAGIGRVAHFFFSELSLLRRTSQAPMTLTIDQASLFATDVDWTAFESDLEVCMRACSLHCHLLGVTETPLTIHF